MNLAWHTLKHTLLVRSGNPNPKTHLRSDARNSRLYLKRLPKIIFRNFNGRIGLLNDLFGRNFNYY